MNLKRHVRVRVIRVVTRHEYASTICLVLLFITLEILFSLQLVWSKNFHLTYPPENFLTPVYILVGSSFFELYYYIHHVTLLFFKRKGLWCCQSIGVRNIWSMFFHNTIAIWILNVVFGFFLGIAELLIFHPVDTVAKRLMSNKAKVCTIRFY